VPDDWTHEAITVGAERLRSESNVSLEGSYIVSEKLKPISAAEIDALEVWLGSPLPRGYPEWMLRFGFGNYCHSINVLPPERIRSTCEEHRTVLREYYEKFWDESLEELPPKDAILGVIFATTDDGDEIYYYPHLDRALFAMPRHDDVVYRLRSGFDDPLDWHSPRRKKPYVYQPSFRYFDPFNSDGRIVELFTAASFRKETLSREIAERFAAAEVRVIAGDNVTHLFLRAIQGQIQLTQSHGEPRVGIRIEYDKDHAAGVEALAADLRAKGFYETGRH
jgi:hypothetical protein